MGSITPRSTMVSLHHRLWANMEGGCSYHSAKKGERERKGELVHNQLLVWFGHLQHDMEFYGKRPSGRWLLWEVTQEVTQREHYAAMPSVLWAPGSTEPG